jgi:hypothetical protein
VAIEDYVGGSGPPRGRVARRRAATNRSSESMVSMSRMRGAYGCAPLAALHGPEHPARAEVTPPAAKVLTAVLDKLVPDG